MTVTYRTATPDDAPALSRLGAATFVETFGHLYSSTNLATFLENHTVDNWTAALAGSAAARLAEVDGAAVGYARIDRMTLPVDPGDRPGVQLYQLYVLKDWHGGGIAPVLMDWMIAEARAQGASDLWLSVYTDNPRARAFYRRYGFVEVMPYAFMVGTQADDDIICKLALD